MPGVLHVVDRERADRRATESSSASVLVTTCFVTWSAITAATATARDRPTARGRRASERSATETGASAVRRRADPDVDRRRPRLRLAQPCAAAGRRCRAAPTGSRAGAPRRSACRRRSQVPYVPSSIRAERGVDLPRAVCCAPSSRPSSSSRSKVDGRMSPRWLSLPRPAISPSSSSRLLRSALVQRTRPDPGKACALRREKLPELVDLSTPREGYPQAKSLPAQGPGRPRPLRRRGGGQGREAAAACREVPFLCALRGARRVLPSAGSLLIGGSLSNLVDRIRLGHVTDFLDVGWWPALNLADSSSWSASRSCSPRWSPPTGKPEPPRRALDVAAR